MTAEQKRAWFVLGVFGVACVAFAVWILTIGVRGAWGTFGLFGLSAFGLLFRRRDRFDERDTMINRRAALAAGLASYTAFVLGCTGVWFVAFAWRRQGQVSVHMFPAVTLAGAIVFYLVHSVAILILYGRQVEPDDA